MKKKATSSLPSLSSKLVSSTSGSDKQIANTSSVDLTADSSDTGSVGKSDSSKDKSNKNDEKNTNASLKVNTEVKENRSTTDSETTETKASGVMANERELPSSSSGSVMGNKSSALGLIGDYSDSDSDST